MSGYHIVEIRGGRIAASRKAEVDENDRFLLKTADALPQRITPHPIDTTLEQLKELPDGRYVVGRSRTQEGYRYFRFELEAPTAQESAPAASPALDLGIRVQLGYKYSAKTIYGYRDENGVMQSSTLELYDMAFVSTRATEKSRFIIDPEPPSHLDGFEDYLNYLEARRNPGRYREWGREYDERMGIAQIIAPTMHAPSPDDIEMALHTWARDLQQLQARKSKLKLRGALSALKYVNRRANGIGLDEDERRMELERAITRRIPTAVRESKRWFRRVVDPNETIYNHLALGGEAAGIVRTIAAGGYGTESGSLLFNEIAESSVEFRRAFTGVGWSNPLYAWDNLKDMSGDSVEDSALFGRYAARIVEKAESESERRGRTWLGARKVKPDEILSSMAVEYGDLRASGVGHETALLRLLAA